MFGELSRARSAGTSRSEGLEGFQKEINRDGNASRLHSGATGRLRDRGRLLHPTCAGAALEASVAGHPKLPAGDPSGRSQFD